MTRWLKSTAICVALFAMVVRALIPMGWMPNPTRSGPLLVLCSMAGPVPFLLGPDGQPVKPDKSHGKYHSVCPFNAAPHFAVAAAAVFIAQPSLDFVHVAAEVARPFASQPKRYEPQTPRAPPSIA